MSELDSSIDADVMVNLSEWSECVTELAQKETKHYNLKEEIFKKEQEIIKNTDFNELYGVNNKDVRKSHLDKVLKDSYDNEKYLEFRINYLKRRISFLKQLIHTKTILMEIKE